MIASTTVHPIQLRGYIVNEKISRGNRVIITTSATIRAVPAGMCSDSKKMPNIPMIMPAIPCMVLGKTLRKAPEKGKYLEVL